MTNGEQLRIDLDNIEQNLEVVNHKLDAWMKQLKLAGRTSSGKAIQYSMQAKVRILQEQLSKHDFLNRNVDI